ncbi:MAG: hypothetical protein PWR07_1410, partial [Bacillota bacterium]|nr:hypothetical protein [Bacillota bacterium]
TNAEALAHAGASPLCSGDNLSGTTDVTAARLLQQLRL